MWFDSFEDLPFHTFGTTAGFPHESPDLPDAEFEAARQGPGAPAGHLDGLDLLRSGTILAQGGFPAAGVESAAASEQMTRLAARLAGEDDGFIRTGGASPGGGEADPDADAPLALTSDSTTSGGDDGEIVVTHPRLPGDGSGGGGTGDGGGLGDPTSPDEEDQNPGLGDDDPPSEDCQKDGEAREIADAINSAGEDGNERAAIIYQDAYGNIVSTSIVVGSPGDVQVALPSGVNMSQVIGFVHSHPIAPRSGDPEIDALYDAADVYPSPTDWDQMDQMVLGGSDPSRLSFYVIDMDGYVREYNYSDKATYDVPEEQLLGLTGTPPPVPEPMTAESRC